MSTASARVENLPSATTAPARVADSPEGHAGTDTSRFPDDQTLAEVWAKYPEDSAKYQRVTLLCDQLEAAFLRADAAELRSLSAQMTAAVPMLEELAKSGIIHEPIANSKMSLVISQLEMRFRSLQKQLELTLQSLDQGGFSLRDESIAALRSVTARAQALLAATPMTAEIRQNISTILPEIGAFAVAVQAYISQLQISINAGEMGSFLHTQSINECKKWIPQLMELRTQLAAKLYNGIFAEPVLGMPPAGDSTTEQAAAD